MPGVNAAACDFGTGCGIIPFYWKRKNAGKVIYAVEIQQKAYNQLCRSVELNGIKNIIPIESD
ncbi:MAG: methyltransferase, partial [Clostridiales bacterium]|nr:methyltransferase [Clostridiales bacterium]